MDNISVIIRNKNEAEYIGFAIQSVIDHFDRPEIIIVDNGSTDDSLGIIKLFNDHDISVIPIAPKDYSPGRALNMGVCNSLKDNILILSAHAQIIGGDFREVDYYLNGNLPKKSYCALFGKQIPIYRGKKITPRYVWSHFTDKPVVNMVSKIEQRPFLHNAFCFYPRQILLDNPFNEGLSGKEDRYWAIDMINNGYDILYSPELVANHYYTTNGATWKGLG